MNTKCEPETALATAAKRDVVVERRGSAGLITLNRPKALNALTLQMVRDLSAALTEWRDDPEVQIVGIRGSNKVGRPGSPEALFGGFCSGGDIRFLHQAVLDGNSQLDDFFTEEYALNHLIHHYAKPTVAFMDGVVMGGGMGIAQGMRLRVATERTKMAMPETQIGFFPDVGGGYFLSRCPGHAGEYLGLTGEVIGAGEALGFGLADVAVESSGLLGLWDELPQLAHFDAPSLLKWIASKSVVNDIGSTRGESSFNTYFSLPDTAAIIRALEAAVGDVDAKRWAIALRKRSPLMLQVSLEQIRRGRHMTLADDLRMERTLVHGCFSFRRGAASETMEGIRALVIDKDYTPRWNPPRIEAVTPQMVAPFFASPWDTDAHPLRGLT